MHSIKTNDKIKSADVIKLPYLCIFINSIIYFKIILSSIIILYKNFSGCFWLFIWNNLYKLLIYKINLWYKYIVINEKKHTDFYMCAGGETI